MYSGSQRTESRRLIRVSTSTWKLPSAWESLDSWMISETCQERVRWQTQVIVNAWPSVHSWCTYLWLYSFPTMDGWQFNIKRIECRLEACTTVTTVDICCESIKPAERISLMQASIFHALNISGSDQAIHKTAILLSFALERTMKLGGCQSPSEAGSILDVKTLCPLHSSFLRSSCMISLLSNPLQPVDAASMAWLAVRLNCRLSCCQSADVNDSSSYLNIVQDKRSIA